MALTEEQKFKLRLYLGWSERFHQHDSALEQAFSALESRPSAENGTIALLAECERIDSAITAAEGRLKATTVGSIELNTMEINQLRDRGRQFVGRIASILGVEVRNDVFSGALPTARASAFGMVYGGNRQMHG
jgi:hypothetical protein